MNPRVLLWFVLVESVPFIIEAVSGELDRRHDRAQRALDREWEREALLTQSRTEAQLVAEEMRFEREERTKDRRCQRDCARIEAEAMVQAAENGGGMMMLSPPQKVVDDDAEAAT